MKGIAIVLMIVGHLSTFGYRLIYSFHMPLFFIIAGYLHSRIEVSNRRLIKDFKRLILPYIITVAVILVIYIVIDIINSSSQLDYWVKAAMWGSASTRHLSPLFGDFPSIGALWFLFALFWCKLFLILYACFSRDRSLSLLHVSQLVFCALLSMKT